MNYPQLYQQQKLARTTGHCDEAIQILDDIHRRWHDHPLIHVKVHWSWALAYGCLGRYGRSAWELFAMLFAAPTSLVQRWFGVARRNI
jgi:hypothetical protein